MKNLWIASSVLAAAAGFALAATGGDDGCTAKAKAAECASVAKSGDCPATGLIAKWEKATKEFASMPAEKLETLSRAQAKLAASCPVCQEAPASFAFLGKFLGSTVALDRLMLASCEEGSESEECDEIPAEVASAFEDRVAIGARANDLFLAFARASAPGEKAECAKAEKATASVVKASAKASECPFAAASAEVAKAECAEPCSAEECCAGAKLTLAEAGKTFESISEEAARLATRWNGVPARAAELPAETKTELLAAMDVLKREAPVCELVDETMTVLAGGLERLVALDKTLAEHCEKASAECTEELPAEYAQMKKAVEARTKATAKVADLLRVMKKTMTPEIFQAPAATAVVGAGQQ